MKAFKLPSGLAVAAALLMGVTACGGGQVASSQDETSGQGASASPIAQTAPPPQTVPPETVPPQTIPPQTVPPETIPPQTVPPQTVPPQTVPPPPRWEAGQTPTALADDGARLERAGYTPLSRGTAEPQMIRVAMHADAWTYVLALPAGTTKSSMANSVKQLNASSRGRMLASLADTTVYVASTGDELFNARGPLSAAQVAEFHEIVETLS